MPGVRFGGMCVRRCCGVGAAGIEGGKDKDKDRGVSVNDMGSGVANDGGWNAGRRAAKRRWKVALRRATEFAAV